MMGSSTCWKGRTESGFRSTSGVPLSAALTQSGMMRSGAKSPPPITFPALAVLTATPCSFRKERT